MDYFAHSSDDLGKQWQTLPEHLTQTANKAECFGNSFNAGEYGYICGILHDVGKYTDKFQEKLKGKNVFVDHSTAGAQLAVAAYGDVWGKLMAYCISGHHSGLPDHGTQVSTDGTLSWRLRKTVENYENYKLDKNMEGRTAGWFYDLSAYLSNDKKNKTTMPNFSGILPVKPISANQSKFMISFFIRMIYSCLVDADFIDTAEYMSKRKIADISKISINELNEICNTFIQSLTTAGKPINYHRAEILKQCLKTAKSGQGLFSLTVPTGGGKTYSSLAFALNHALRHNLERIIYVIPYTSIIEQTAQIFKNIFGEEYVLEHHSNYQYEKKDEENADLSENSQNIEDKLKSASENWDIPIVVTTNVQFFESLFANRSSKCRKLHNIAKSVIVFDEAQMLPHEYMKPCLAAVAELVHNYKATALLCTATQPSVNRFLPAGTAPAEIIQDPVKLYEIFKKVRIVKRGIMDDETLIAELNALDNVLCIVNTKRHAKEIYKGLTGNSFYLTTLMCPVHRKEIIQEIKESLKNNISCKVVSTQLIEAGVDIDFPIVYRSLAGIDSIIQSAGRCNREGNAPSADVHVFETNSKYGMTRGYLQRTARVANEVLRKFDDPISIEAINRYFDLLYEVEGDDAFDKKEIMSCFNKSLIEFDFETAARKFKLIESNTYPILIPYDENAKNLIESLHFSKYPQSLMRKLQPYTVSVYENQLKSLSGSLDVIKDCYYVLPNIGTYYDPYVGLIVPEDPNGEAIFV